MEILKQAQYSPLHVSKQIAIIFCGTRNLLRNIPARSVANFEIEFLHHMETMHKDVLDNLGKLSAEQKKQLSAYPGFDRLAKLKEDDNWVLVLYKVKDL